MRERRPYADDETRRLAKMLQRHAPGMFVASSWPDEYVLTYLYCDAIRVTVSVGRTGPFEHVALPVGFDERRAMLLLRDLAKKRVYDRMTIPKPGVMQTLDRQGERR